MANPIFGRGEGFTKHREAPQYQPQPSYDPYLQQYQQQAPMPQGPVMTYDDVIAKTGLSLGLVFVMAAAAFMLVPLELAMPVMIGSSIAGFITVLIVSMRRVVSPVGLGIYAVFEGLFVGAVSKFFELLWPGIVVTAVLATFVTAAATLAVMKFAKIRVSAKFRQMVTIATFAFVGVVLVNLVLALFGIDTGMRDVGGGASILAIGVSVIAIALAVFNLVMDFDAVRVGVEQRVPASESWRAALGITVTMVWLYVEILRVLSYFRD